ncbi:hypothetical protein [Pseudomonas oryzihabitans]|uniref:Uncharacterized protein n=1 Tax=Pseudomonas oryzihabitans TaxID=47885 RepID=A0A178LJV3_9PSED|nr:hypothetical protein [Pseudomonas oryzihabitans]OAN31124.1 hypothetical protein A4V15_14025 [Pseudomonas oryzihabitans]
MTKFTITVEDTQDPNGVQISLDNKSQLHDSAAGRVALSMLRGATLIGRIPLPITAGTPGCNCEVCQATRELLETQPTIH